MDKTLKEYFTDVSNGIDFRIQNYRNELESISIPYIKDVERYKKLSAIITGLTEAQIVVLQELP